MASTSTIPPEDPIRIIEVGATPTSEFTFDFVFFENADIEVSVGAVKLVEVADYTLVGNPRPPPQTGFDGGTVTTVNPVQNATVTIQRNIIVKRDSDFPIKGPFQIAALNTELDRLTAMLQEREYLSRFAVTSPLQSNLELGGFQISISDVNGNVIGGLLPGGQAPGDTVLLWGSTDGSTVSFPVRIAGTQLFLTSNPEPLFIDNGRMDLASFAPVPDERRYRIEVDSVTGHFELLSVDDDGNALAKLVEVRHSSGDVEVVQGDFNVASGDMREGGFRVPSMRGGEHIVLTNGPEPPGGPWAGLGEIAPGFEAWQYEGS